jgi:hypothetical protein
MANLSYERISMMLEASCFESQVSRRGVPKMQVMILFTPHPDKAETPRMYVASTRMN